MIKEKQDELEEYKKLREAQTCDNSDSRIKGAFLAYIVLVNRKIVAELEEAIENLKREKELALRRLAVANELIAEVRSFKVSHEFDNTTTIQSEQEVSIREPYDETQKPSSKRKSLGVDMAIVFRGRYASAAGEAEGLRRGVQGEFQN